MRKFYHKNLEIRLDTLKDELAEAKQKREVRRQARLEYLRKYQIGLIPNKGIRAKNDGVADTPTPQTPIQLDPAVDREFKEQKLSEALIKTQIRNTSSDFLQRNYSSFHPTKPHKSLISSWEFQRIKECLISAISTAKQRGLEVKVTLEDLVTLYKKQQGKCALSGRRFNQLTNIISLDRIDNDESYLRSNIQFTTWEVNRTKSTMSNEKFLKLCSDIYFNKKKKSENHLPASLIDSKQST